MYLTAAGINRYKSDKLHFINIEISSYTAKLTC